MVKFPDFKEDCDEYKNVNLSFEFKIISSKGEYKNPENLAELFYD